MQASQGSNILATGVTGYFYVKLSERLQKGTVMGSSSYIRLHYMEGTIARLQISLKANCNI
jgi:hypothetical protein